MNIVDEKILLIQIIGALEAMQRGSITITEGEKYIFSPRSVNKYKEARYSDNIINLIERGCELEDIESLLPNKISSSMEEIKEDALMLLNKYDAVEDKQWL